MIKKNTIIFVDYENWYRSIYLLYGCRPDVDNRYSGLKESYECEQIYFFANFSKYTAWKSEIMNITENIIDTNSEGSKDMTDFIMLDYIYRISQKASPHTYIIFSGDGHFEKAIQNLIHEKRKEVIVYAIHGSLSPKLKQAASQYVELPTMYDTKDLCFRAVVKKISQLDRMAKNIRQPLYSTIVKEISLQLEVHPAAIEDILQEMISLNYLNQIGISQHKKGEDLLLLNKFQLKEKGFYI